jgi:WD40 repeat protein
MRVASEQASVLPCEWHGPAGRHILSSSLDGCIRLWDYEKGKAVKFYRVSAVKL